MTKTAARQPMSVGRLEAFSDGVFAIAITLLILEIRLPGEPESDQALLQELVRLWPSYLSYAVSVLLIGMVWMNHHRMFHHIRQVDGFLLLLNILLLASVTFLPFPTHVLAEAVHVQRGEHTAAVFYGMVLVIGGVFYNALWCYASIGHRLLGDTITPAEAAALRIRWGMGPVVYLVAAAIGLWSAVASLVFYVLLLLFYFLDLRPRRADVQ
ncbi:DUF1211 domain-containing protein [Solihabitans fulvus]|uniref:DUF1211 domain-containing protein n=1 Tax=Solihabitans fulvus TaxID=1892852 RepID=A0A5B2WLR9_9PSEU|nr:TMEM175 family protein [Solihabitans fulvus]KAA2250977.1 DUF1211 domain-containing protein [Solihabitans fulvus]